jgi:beta-phosphoglucomutase-like phosphatase (HAD superfamily)
VPPGVIFDIDGTVVDSNRASAVYDDAGALLERYDEALFSRG